MELTVQILTKNQQSLLRNTLRSLEPLKARVFINDLASKDSTLDIAREFGAHVFNHQDEDRSVIRNRLINEAGTKWHMYLEPGEVIVKGIEQISKNQFDACHMSVIVQGTLRKEIRLWNSEKGFQFCNPIFEVLDCNLDFEVDTYINSPIALSNDTLQKIYTWKAKCPTKTEPYYYEAMTLLSLGQIDNFVNVSQHYMFLDNKKTSIPSIMNRYYFALVQLQKRDVKSTLQNINLCLCANPLMAEFWCVIGDVYYHLLRLYDKAISCYKNAIILGARRKKNCKWPMDISKYKEYPTMMIENCKVVDEASYAVSFKI